MNTLAEPAQGARSPDAGTFPSRRDVPLVPASSIAGRALVTVIAIMTFLASLAAGGAILVAGTSRTWQHAVGREMTVQVRPLAGRDIDADVAKAAGHRPCHGRCGGRRGLRQGSGREAPGALARGRSRPQRSADSPSDRREGEARRPPRSGRLARPARRHLRARASTTTAPGSIGSPPCPTRWSPWRP